MGDVDTEAGSDSMEACELGWTGAFVDEGECTLVGVLKVCPDVGVSKVLMRKAVLRRKIMSESVTGYDDMV